MTITDAQVEDAIEAGLNAIAAALRKPYIWPRQARFWIVTHTGGSARIKLNVGDTFVHRSGGPTDEGFVYETIIYEFDGKQVTYTTYIRARDCDGLHEHKYSGFCPVSCLQKGDADDGVTFPAWEDSVESQRDFSAETMGY